MMKQKLNFVLVLIMTIVPPLTLARAVIDDSAKPGYLYVISGSSGNIAGDILTLNGVPNVVYFSDRPVRKAGHMRVAEFVGLWDLGDDSFKSDPPNAALSILEEDRTQDVVLEVISVSEKKGTLHFQVKPLKGNLTASFGASSLFIDVGVGMSGSGTF